MSSYVFTISGTDREIEVETFNISETLNAVDTMTIDVRSLPSGSPYRPPINAPVVCTEDGTPIFGGLVESAEETGFGGYSNTTGIVTRVTVKSYYQYLSRKVLTVTLPAGTLKSQLVALVALYPVVFGLTLSGSQADGPTMPEFTFNQTSGDQILTALMTAATSASGGTGWVAKVSPTKVLRARAVGDEVCAFNVVDGDGHAVHDVTVERTRNDLYANKINGIFSGAGPATSTETFVAADGISAGGFTRFTAKYPASDSQNDWWPNELTFDGVDQGPIEFGVALPFAWSWDHANHQLVYDESFIGYAFPTGSQVVSIKYTIAYPFTLTAVDAVAYAADPWERTIEIGQGLNLEAAQALLDGMLLQQSPVKSVVHYQTRETAVHPGMTQTATVAKRDLNDTVLVQEVETTRLTSTEVIRAVSAVPSQVYQGTFRETLAQWMQAGKGNGGVQTTDAAMGALPGGRNRDVQFNDNGAFGGVDDVLLDKDGSGDVYGPDSLKARFAVGADTGDSVLIYHEEFAAGQSNTSMKTNGGVYNHYPAGNEAIDPTYPYLKYSENVKEAAGIGPAGENVIEPWQVSGSPAAGVSAILFDGFGPEADTRWNADHCEVYADWYLDSATMTAASAFDPLLQIWGVTTGAFPATGTGAGQFPTYTSGDIQLATYLDSGDTWKLELSYRRTKTSGSPTATIATFTYSKTAMQNAWHRFKLVWQCGTVVTWANVGNTNDLAAISQDGWIKVYFDDTLAYDITGIGLYLSAHGSSGTANFGQAAALGFDGMPGPATNLTIGIPNPTALAQQAWWNTQAGKANALTEVVDHEGNVTLKTPKDFTIIADHIFLNGAEASSLGDVVGPSSAVDGSLVVFDGTTGKLLKHGTVIGPTNFTGGTMVSALDWATVNQPVGTIFSIYDFVPSTAGQDLNYIDLEPGYDDGPGTGGATIPVGKDFFGLFSYPWVKTAASGTHAQVFNNFFGGGTLTLGAATITRAATVYIDDRPNYADIASENYSLLVDGGTCKFPYVICGVTDVPESVATGAPGADMARIYSEDNGSGKTKLMVRFNTGSAIQLAIEP